MLLFFTQVDGDNEEFHRAVYLDKIIGYDYADIGNNTFLRVIVTDSTNNLDINLGTGLDFTTKFHLINEIQVEVAEAIEHNHTISWVYIPSLLGRVLEKYPITQE